MSPSSSSSTLFVYAVHREVTPVCFGWQSGSERLGYGMQRLDLWALNISPEAAGLLIDSPSDPHPPLFQITPNFLFCHSKSLSLLIPR